MKKIIFLFILVSAGKAGFSQDLTKDLCGKKWYPDKYSEKDGKIYELDKETKSLYTLFNCDGTFESWEDKNLLVKGTWTYNAKTKTVKLKSSNAKVPMDESVKIISCDGKKLAFTKTDGGGEVITIYSITR
jgi:hypothetical protein